MWKQERDIVSIRSLSPPTSRLCNAMGTMRGSGLAYLGPCNSCERCQSRKSKCDRQRPSCQRCRDAGALCRYQGRKRPGFPAGHRELLEDKIRESG